ncbi:MAG TPA: EAL domain-containing protein [Actinomycetota bacterium]|nr:EAL domain-containing protein [Actinomycetota bacterium]
MEDHYSRLIEHIPAVIYLKPLDPGAPLIDVSPNIEELFGATREQWLTGPTIWLDTIHPDDRERVAAANDRAIATGEPFHAEYRATSRDGRSVFIREDAVLVRDDAGAPLYWLGFMLDVTESVRTRLTLDDTQARYGALIEQIPAIVYVDVADDRMTTSYVSPQIEAILGITPQEYLDDPDLWASMLHPDDRDLALETYLRGRESGQPFTFEYRLLARDGRVVWFRDSAVVIRNEGALPLIHGVMLDITDRKEAEAQLAFLAYHDKLTGLPNRTLFEELLQLSLARARRHDLGVAVLYLDLDNFKLVNDSLGREAGDRLLLQLSERLRSATRETDLVARPGGDEFLLLLSDLERIPPVPGGTDGAVLMAQSVAVRIQQAMQSPFELDGTEVYVSGSVGVSIFPMDAANFESLMNNADTAMLRSKKSGPGGFVLHAADDGDAMSKLSLSTRLRKAVESQAWTLHYQPVIAIESGAMAGVEALIRWRQPGGGLVPPGEFIPLAEEMGLIEAIGDWVVEEICRQDSAWRAEGLVTEIGFNLSPRQLWQPDLVAKIVSRLIAAGMEPGRVVAEITESTAMTDPERTQQVLFDLHARGLRLAIDDFGTGYSSLARLKHLPVDILKIDRSFVRDVDSDRDAQSMVAAMIGLASNLGMTALAEGIETEAERRFLLARGCPLGQGFLFSKPVAPEDLLAFHRRSELQVIEGQAG